MGSVSAVFSVAVGRCAAGHVCIAALQAFLTLPFFLPIQCTSINDHPVIP